MKLQQAENIIKREILKRKGKKYNYKYISTDILFITLDNVGYNYKELTKDLIIKVVDLYLKREEEEKKKYVNSIDFLPF